MTVVLLGSQRHEPTIAEAADHIQVRGPVAVITAGWQEREPEDEELSAHLGRQTVNLRLHRRADDVFRRDEPFAAAYRARQVEFRHLQDAYRIRLEHLTDAATVVGNRVAPRMLLAQEHQTFIDTLRFLDSHHQARCDAVRRRFRETWNPSERPSVHRHREQLRELIADCTAVAISGGHVASLLNRIKLFDLPDLIGDRPILAWSAGAMVLTEHVVLYHDLTPQRLGSPQVLDIGLGLVPGLVVLPAPEQRLASTDPTRMVRYFRRFAPRRCVTLPARSWLVIEEGAIRAVRGAQQIEADGRVGPLGEEEVAA